MKFTFTTRDEYFAYKSEWKEIFYATIREIRKSALARRDADREMSKNFTSATWGAAQRARRNHVTFKFYATELLQERRESKIEAGRQMMANRNK